MTGTPRPLASCLVTGVAGFIGSHLAERLVASGVTVHGVDCFTEYYQRHLKEANLARLRGSPLFSLNHLDLATDPVGVYGHENNGLVHRVIDPLRKGVASRLPHQLLNVIAMPLAMVLQALVKGVYRPLRGTSVFDRLPLHAYLYSLSRFSFRQNLSIVFDHLVAPTAFYLRREEFERWFADSGLENVEITWRNENSWRGRGEVARTPTPPSPRGSPAAPGARTA